MKLYLSPHNNTLIPYYDDDKEKFKKLKPEDVYECTIRRDRNYKFHKKFFALLKLGYENTKLENISEHAYRAYITMKAGFYEWITVDGKKYPVAKSIAFDKMDEDEFTELYNKALSVVAVDIEATKEVIEHELLSFL